MKDSTLKQALSLLFVVVQFLLLAFAFWHASETGGFAVEEAIDTTLIVGPMLAVYGTTMVRHVFLPTTPPSRKKRPFTYCFMAFFFFSVFFFSLFWATQSKANSALTFDQYKLVVALIDTLFSVYLSLIMTGMFSEQKANAVAKPVVAEAG